MKLLDQLLRFMMEWIDKVTKEEQEIQEEADVDLTEMAKQLKDLTEKVSHISEKKGVTSNITAEMEESFKKACAAKAKAKNKAPPTPPTSTTTTMSWKCSACKADMIEKFASRGGRFLGCSRWPDCDGTRQYSNPEKANEGPCNRAKRLAAEKEGQDPCGSRDP